MRTVAAPMPIVPPNLKTTNFYFTNYVFNIPTYQRGFSWTEPQWRELWIDIEEIPTALSHYLGSTIVCHVPYQWHTLVAPVNRSELQLIDGQQRTTALMLLLKALSHHANALDAGGVLFQNINTNIYFSGTDNVRYTVLQNDNVNFKQCYEGIIFSGTYAVAPPAVLNRPQKLMVGAFEYFKQTLTRKLGDLTAAGRLPYLTDLHDRISNRLKITMVPLTGDLEPSLVFEAINNRGIPLSSLDRVKNLIMLIDSRRKERANRYSTEADRECIAAGGAPRTGPIAANVTTFREAGNPCSIAKQALVSLRESIANSDPVANIENHSQIALDASHATQTGFRFESTWFKVITKMSEYNLSKSSDENKLLAHYWCMLETGGRFYPDEVYNNIHDKFWILTKGEEGHSETLLTKFCNGLLDVAKSYCEFFVKDNITKFGTLERFPGVANSDREKIKQLIKDYRCNTDTMMSTLSMAVYLQVDSAIEYKEYLQFLEKSIFRVYKVAGKRSNDFLTVHGNNARLMYNSEHPQTRGGRVTTPIEHAKSLLCSFTLSHCTLIQMQNILNTRDDAYNWQSGSVARYFLFMYERKLMPAAIPNISYGDFKVDTHIEHILPKTPNRPYWLNKGGQPQKRFSELELVEGHPSCLIHNLGNLVLSEGDANILYGNRGYNVKRKKYIDLNDLLRVREIANQYTDWRNTCIEHRRIKMINFAVNDDGSGSGRWELDCDSEHVPAALTEIDCDEYNPNQVAEQEEGNAEEE